MCTDVLNLIISYIRVNNILTINNTKLVDKILRIYKLQIPNIDIAIDDGDFEVVKYLIKQGYKPTSKDIDNASCNNNIIIVKYLVKYGAKIIPSNIDEACI